MAQDPSTVQAQPVFQIGRIYLKGVSVELPQGAGTFNINEKIEYKIDLNLTPEILNESFSQVALRATVSSVLPDQSVLYLIEAEWAGIFEIHGFSNQDKDSILNVTAPTIIMPYLRSFVQDTMGRSNLPLVILPELNWGEMFRQKSEAQSQQLLQAPTPETVQ